MVDIKNSPEIYFIFASIILNKITNIVFNFYESEGDVHISFFKNKYMKSIRNTHYKKYGDTHEEILDTEDELLNLIEEY